MKKIRVPITLLTCAVLFSTIFSLPVLAGKNVQRSEPVVESGELNQTDWYFADSNIVNENGTVVVPAEASNSNTRFIAKTVSVSDEKVEEMTRVSTTIQLTALPKEQRFILAFGLGSIEALPGETGNVEMSFTNEDGVKLGITAYTEAGAQELMGAKGCGISMNGNFTLDAAITPQGVLTVKINNKLIYEGNLPVSGEGRFGVLQTGGCGVKISKLSYTCSQYETPENTNIFEDFEDGEFNANLLYANTFRTNGLYPGGMKIQKEEGNTVLRFQNVGLGHLATRHKYSNFEISFDMPYFLRENVYDENGILIGKPSSNIGVSFGSEQIAPDGHAYVHDIDLITISTNRVRSEVRKGWTAMLEDMGVVDMSNNEGYSFKLTVVDGHSECYVKKVASDKWIKAGEMDYDLQRSGYIYIWSTGNADCTIDNLKITNLDENPNLIEVPYKSSVVTAEDYELTEEEKTLKFREVEEEEPEKFDAKRFFICCGGGAVVLAGIGIGVGALLRRNKQEKEVSANEK